MPRSLRWAALGLLLGANLGAIAVEALRAERLAPGSRLILPQAVGAGGALGCILALLCGLFASLLDLDAASEHFPGTKIGPTRWTTDLHLLAFPFLMLGVVRSVLGDVRYYVGLLLLGMLLGEIGVPLVRGQTALCLWMVGGAALGAGLGAATGWVLGGEEAPPTEGSASSSQGDPQA